MAFSYRTSGFGRFEAGIDKLFLPFSDDGETVSHIFICLYASSIDPWSDERATIQDYERDGGTVAFDPTETLSLQKRSAGLRRPKWNGRARRITRPALYARIRNPGACRG